MILKTRCLGGLVSSVQNLTVRDVIFDWRSCIFVSSTHLDIFLFVVENLFIQFSNTFQRESATRIVAVIKVHALVLTCQTICNPMDVVHQEYTKLLCPWDSLGKNAEAGCHFLLHRNLLNSGIEPMSPTLAGGMFITVPYI